MSTQSLASMKIGQRGTISEIMGDDAITRRLLEMGLIDGELVEILALAPLGDPIDVRIRGYQLSLRRREAERVQVAVS